MKISGEDYAAEKKCRLEDSNYNGIHSEKEKIIAVWIRFSSTVFKDKLIFACQYSKVSYNLQHLVLQARSKLFITFFSTCSRMELV